MKGNGQACNQASNIALAWPLITSLPVSSVVEISISARCSPASCLIEVIVAVAVKVAPGNT